MKNTNFITYTLFFFLGVGFQYVVALALTDNPAPSNNTYNETAQYDQNNIEQLIDEKISILDSKMDTISYSIEKLSLAIHQPNVSQEISDTNSDTNSDTDKDTESLEESEHAFKDNSIVSVKDRLYSNLSNPTYTLPDILDSKEMSSLPKPEQQKVLAEIARRIDSGEIDKFQFLPGYSERAEN